MPRKRSGEAYFPSFLEPRRPCEQAIVSVVMEAYVNGVSTRKVDRLVGRRYLSAESIALALEGQGDEDPNDESPKEVPQLQPA